MRKKDYVRICTALLMFLGVLTLKAQEKQQIYDYLDEGDYIIGGVSVSGVRYLDVPALIGISGLRTGQEITIPGDAVTKAVQRLWQQGLFSDVRLSIIETRSDTIFFDIFLQERPRISAVRLNGIRKSETEDLNEKIKLPVGSQVTSFILNNTQKVIKEHYVEKGFLNTTVEFVQKDDPDQPNNIILYVNIDKKEKVKIGELTFEGNEYFKETKLRRQMKDTKKKNYNIFKVSKYIDEKYNDDKEKLITFYNDNGFRDFTIISDSLYKISEDRVGIKLKIEEGDQYFLRNVRWVGNSVYTKEDLERVFNVEKGSVYNQSLILDRLNGLSGAEDAVSNLYLDHGYLFSHLTPVEANIENDSIDLEIRIYEGDQAYLNDIIIAGNTRTNEHVARRELYTLPGDLFSKDLIIRSIRQLGVLGHFDPEKINPTPLQDQINGTVDLLYQLEEKANDQFEISGGWGAGMLVGTVGVRFNNFAMKNFFKLDEWKPYPSGDGQSLSIRAQSNGRIYQSYNVSFVEPWLGGKKNNTFSVSLYRSVMTNGTPKGEQGRQAMIIDGATIGLGKRLSWPDDFFSIYGDLSYSKYDLNNYSYYRFLFENGQSNLLSLNLRLTRFSTSPNLIYPRSGSSFTFSIQATPPYTFISGKDMSAPDITDEEKYKWIEFHKWTFKSDYYFPLTKNDKLVLNARFAFGYLGFYNKYIGPSPFENFYIGGDGMTGYSFYGREVIALRGYTNGSLTPIDSRSGAPAGNVYSKITFELRYPLSLNQQATIYALAFLESGRAWSKLNEYNPFRMNRSAGIGLRANLPMFGLLGIDWGYGFDAVPTGESGANKSQFHFVIGQQF
ncbi:MAG TPA: outer membrane protein assembly factor BamA [Bacteroidales bacterium]|nr:outer membrane protein assembly factor BamA [Bacteroidales bacterium]HPF03537.1 outer membrane protein assembly factor BamA [Bacteroidales bacterium]HPJ60414.1 outer membrane protein assembly factor BamA [Bacteroidales bacterium]HPR12726.1 outer membrane protein assembly factor BamA [Bacteroidales bacterium]HRW85596.1 outer membrane protein assembly factor BamA [Bacteroidales bacterium]